MIQEIINSLINVVNNAEITSASYTGGLPNKIVKKGSKGSDVKKLQKFLNWCPKVKAGLKVDGSCGDKTVKAIKKFQKAYGLVIDGIFGAKSKAKAKKIIEQYKPKPAPTPTEKTIIDKELEACADQAEWMKNYTYKWQQNPTVPKSKKYGTCVTYVACVLQRIGILKSGEWVWMNSKNKVIGANSKMSVTYMSGTIKSHKNEFKRGDILIGGNGKIGAGKGSHIMILTGGWNGNDPYVYDNNSANRVRKGQKAVHTWPGSYKMIARIRLK